MTLKGKTLKFISHDSTLVTHFYVLLFKGTWAQWDKMARQSCPCGKTNIMVRDSSDSLKYAACQLILYGHFADSIAVIESGLAQGQENFLI